MLRIVTEHIVEDTRASRHSHYHDVGNWNNQAAASQSIPQAAGHVMSHCTGVVGRDHDVLECGEVLQMDWVNGAGGLLLSGACFQVTNPYYHFSWLLLQCYVEDFPMFSDHSCTFPQIT